MIRDLGRVGGGWAGRHAGRWAGGIFACLPLVIAGPAMARQATAAPAAQTYAECTRAYASRRDVVSYCRRLFPQTPAVTSYASCVEAMGRTAEARKLCAQRYPDGAPRPSEPVDITPQLNKLIDVWAGRPRTPAPPSQGPARPPADPLAVIPEIQAACAAYAAYAERWRRCTTDAWNSAGLRGQPPLALQVPPAPPPLEKPPVERPPILPEPTDQTPVKPPPVRPEPPPVAKPAVPEPPVLVQPDLPVDVALPVKSEPPLKPEPDPPKLADPPLPPQLAPPSIPLWAWLLAAVVALVAAGAGGYGLSRWLSTVRPQPDPQPLSLRPAQAQAQVQAAPGAPAEIALVADPGVVALIPDGPPRAGMAVSMRFALDADVDADAVRLEYPSLETAP